MKFHYDQYLYAFLKGSSINSIKIFIHCGLNFTFLSQIAITVKLRPHWYIPIDIIPLHVWPVPSQSRWAELPSRSQLGGWCGGGQTAAWSLQSEQSVSFYMLLHDYITKQANIWPQWIKYWCLGSIWGSPYVNLVFILETDLANPINQCLVYIKWKVSLQFQTLPPTFV